MMVDFAFNDFPFLRRTRLTVGSIAKGCNSAEVRVFRFSFAVFNFRLQIFTMYRSIALLFSVFTTLCALPCFAQQDAWTDKTRVLPEALRQIPDGLFVWDTPNPSYPKPDSANPGTFVWRHNTNVRTQVVELTVIAAGSYIWYSASGWQANITLTTKEFEAFFNCPNAKLMPEKVYTYKNNNRTANNDKQLYGGDALWYVLAKDKAGKLYKGITLVETEAGPSR
jgi:hypothetical protein